MSLVSSTVLRWAPAQEPSESEHRDSYMQGQGIALRRAELDDLSFIRTLWSDTASMQEVGGPIVLSDEKATAWFHAVARGAPRHWYYLIIAESGAPIGEVGAHRMDPRTGQADFNVKVLHTERGRGHGLCAATLFCDRYFTSLDGEVLVDPIAVGNELGRGLLERVGFEFVEEQRDICLMRLTKASYLETRSRRQE